MLVLGWHGNPQLQESEDSWMFGYHDAAAAIFRDGVLVAAVEEERLNRSKHSSAFPKRAIRFCLAEACAAIDDVAAIVTDLTEDYYNHIVSRDACLDPRLPMRSARELLTATFNREFGVDLAARFHFCKHHMAHLYSAWYPSGLSDALVVCLDGDGDGASGLVAHCDGDKVRVLRQLPHQLSLGNFYTYQLFFLGYQRFDEYKAMGLAPYGNPEVYEPVFKRLYQLQPEGRFTILPQLDGLLVLNGAGITLKARRKGEPFTQAHKDFAAALQATLERIVDHVVGHFQKVTGARRLCMSGGVAHNCTLNGKLLRSGRFEQVYVQPAAHDAGNAVGAALSYLRDAGQYIAPKVMPHLFLGTNIGSADDIGRRLQAWRPFLEFERVASAAETAAELLVCGSVIGWVQGRAEFGPRALGNRSILADPRPAGNKDIINEMVKKRENFRPFAPAVIEERLRDYFQIPTGAVALPFMVITVQVRPEVRALLGAVTHIDGSARVQSVSRDDNARFHALIEAFGNKTGVPVVLNTSFNNHAEPIVDSIDDAVTTFLTTGINELLIGDWLVRKSHIAPRSTRILGLRPALPAAQKLVRRTSAAGVEWFGIESTNSRVSGQPPIAVSGEIFSVLAQTGQSSMQARCRRLGVTEPAALEALSVECFDLWSARAIGLLPDVGMIS